MNHDVGAAAVAAGLLAFALTGCATVSEPRPSGVAAAPAASASGTSLEGSTVAYVRSVCEMPKEQREPALRELNESLVPNHAVIYCGRGGTP